MVLKKIYIFIIKKKSPDPAHSIQTRPGTSPCSFSGLSLWFTVYFVGGKAISKCLAVGTRKVRGGNGSAT